MLPIDNPLRQTTIGYTLRVAMGANDSVNRPRRSLDRADRRPRAGPQCVELVDRSYSPSHPASDPI